MFNSKLRKRVTSLERDIETLKHDSQALLCIQGEHADWEMEPDCGGRPFIRCSHCWKSLDKDTKE